MSYDIWRKDNIRHPSIFPMICTIRSDVTIRTSGRAVEIEKMSLIERSPLRWGWIDPIKRQNNKSTTSASWWFGNLWLNNHDHVTQVNLLSHKQASKCSRCKDWLWQCLHFDGWWWWRGGRIELHMSPLSKCQEDCVSNIIFLLLEEEEEEDGHKTITTHLRSARGNTLVGFQ